MVTLTNKKKIWLLTLVRELKIMNDRFWPPSPKRWLTYTWGCFCLICTRECIWDEYPHDHSWKCCWVTIVSLCCIGWFHLKHLFDRFIWFWYQFRCKAIHIAICITWMLVEELNQKNKIEEHLTGYVFRRTKWFELHPYIYFPLNKRFLN